MLAGLLADLGENAIIVFAVAIGGVAGMTVERVYTKMQRAAWRAKRGYSRNGKWMPGRSNQEAFDPATQLRLVTGAKFKARRLLNASEARLFSAVERAVVEETSDWRVMAQVSLGEVLSSPSKDAYRAINSKRVDLLLVNAQGDPLHAIEYQGRGHHQGTAAVRDAIKKEALRKAGVGYIEVVPGDTPAEVRQMVRKLAGK